MGTSGEQKGGEPPGREEKEHSTIRNSVISK
jgi:hypothetical protein